MAGNGKLKKAKDIMRRYGKDLMGRYKVNEIAIFGSYARGEQKKKSDMDVLVEFEDVPGLFKFLELERYLTKLMGVKVDLVRRKALRPELKDTILSEAVFIWPKEIT